jgi:hypothetical protein
MTPLTEEAVALLQRAQFQIQNDPKRFDMSIWDTGKLVDIAGIIANLNNERLTMYEDEELSDDIRLNVPTSKLARYLGITFDEARALCFTQHWPPKLRDRYHTAETDADRAAAGILRIDYFLKFQR